MSKPARFDFFPCLLHSPSVCHHPARDEVGEFQNLAPFVTDHDVVDDELIHVH